jgi:hypothetical protein
VTNSVFAVNAAASGSGIFNSGTLMLTSSTLSAPLGNSEGSVGVPVNNLAAPVIPQSISSLASVALSGTSSSGAAASPAAPAAITVAPPPGSSASSTSPGAPAAETDALFTDLGAASADTAQAMPAPEALSAAIVALDSTPGASDARLVPLRESTLALVGTLVVVTLESAPGRSIPPPAGPPGNGPGPVSRGGQPWEHLVIGLDQDFDQFRRTFREPPRDEDAGLSLSLRSGSETTASPVRDIPASSATVRSVSPPEGRDLRSDESLIEPSGPEETRPLQISLSCAAIALAAGCVWLRRQVIRKRTQRTHGYEDDPRAHGL